MSFLLFSLLVNVYRVFLLTSISSMLTGTVLRTLVSTSKNFISMKTKKHLTRKENGLQASSSLQLRLKYHLWDMVLDMVCQVSHSPQKSSRTIQLTHGRLRGLMFNKRSVLVVESNVSKQNRMESRWLKLIGSKT